jgi:Copper type II ascorbate-dependent monooxygenase, C-terminal domain
MVLSFAGISLAHGASTPASAPTTYTEQVAPLLRAHCGMCHSAGSSAPQLPLVTYEQARGSAAQIFASVQSGAMPPWPIDTAHSAPMRNDPRLSTAEIAVLQAWVAAGLPLGPAVESPAQPTGDAWGNPRHVPPDTVIVLPSIPVPAQGELPYLRMLVRVSSPEDRWIGALQALPGNRAVVHHMGIAEVRLPSGVGPKQIHDLEQVAKKLGIPAGSLLHDEPAVIDTTLSGDYDMLAAFTPGEGFESFPNGTGKLLRAGESYYINFNVHYTTVGTATSDQSRLGLWFLKTPPARQLFRTPSPGRTILAEGHELYPDDPGSKAEGTDVAIPPIPPYADNYELIGITAYERPVVLYSFQPHAHLRAKDFRYDLVYPDGHTQTLLSIPKYDYHWQLSYALATPVEVPAGSKLVVTAHYDNSAANQHLREFSATNPGARCGPDKYAYFRRQNQTWDEMFSPIVQYALHARRDTSGGDSHLHTVSAQGCLVPAAAPRWELTHASQAQPSQSPTISRAELAATAHAPGASAYALIGLEPFRPQSLSGERVLIKGVKIPGKGAGLINVTGLQDLGDRCVP